MNQPGFRPHRGAYSAKAPPLFVLLAWPALLAAFIVPSAARATALLKKGVFSGGGAVVSGGSYRLGFTVGECGVVGLVSGGTRRLGEGFWPGEFLLVADVPETPKPEVFVNELKQNLPNPFRGPTAIEF